MFLLLAYFTTGLIELNTWNVTFHHIKEPYQMVLNKGVYTVELWGADGGKGCMNGAVNYSTGGKGSYVKARLKVLSPKVIVSMFVGGIGASGKCNTGSPAEGGWNGGGTAGRETRDTDSPGAGGGATDLRLSTSTDWKDTHSLDSRILVAAGGSGGQWAFNGAPGGALYGITNVYRPDSFQEDTSVSQTEGYKKGIGQDGAPSDVIPTSGAGAGYYGGRSVKDADSCSISYGGFKMCQVSSSGSSFIAGYPGCSGMESMLSQYKIKVEGIKMLGGNEVPNQNERSGDGFAVITRIEEFDTKRVSPVSKLVALAFLLRAS